MRNKTDFFGQFFIRRKNLRMMTLDHRNADGYRHRDGGLPAVEWSDGDNEWWVNGELHRDGGLPAVERANGANEWWVNGIHIQLIVWNDSPKLEDWTGETCIISLETIRPDSSVAKCDVCSAIMLFDPLSEWLVVSKTCPHCRSKWTSTVRYI